MKARLALVATLTSCLVALAPDAAHANGRFPAANHLVTYPRDPSRILLRATFGFLFSADRGQTWDWVCERAIGYSGSQDPPIGVLANGTVAATLFEGLTESSDNGCTWGFAKGSLDKQVMIDVAVRPDHPEAAVAITGTFVGEDDAGTRYRSEIYETKDEGATWNPLGTAVDQRFVVETLDVAPSDPQRLYVSAIKGAGANTTGHLFVSTNAGATWTERAIPMDASFERAPFIAAVDPVNADRVYVRTHGPADNRLLVTDDAGKTFREVFRGGPLLGFALADNGGKVFLGGPRDGLRVASRTDLTFTQKSALQVECLMSSGTTLFACSNESQGFLVGASEDEGATFKPLLRLSTIRGQLACGAAEATCAREWAQLKAQYGINTPEGGAPTSDAGNQPPPSDAAGSGNKAPAKSSCGCTTVGGGPTPWTALVGVLAVCTAGARRIRPRSRPSRAAR